MYVDLKKNHHTPVDVQINWATMYRIWLTFAFHETEYFHCFFLQTDFQRLVALKWLYLNDSYNHINPCNIFITLISVQQLPL